MNTDRNLLFGVLALQTELIDATQFIEACLLWTTRKEESLADLLLGRGWIELADSAHVEYLVERKLQRHGGNVHASLAAIPDDIKHSLAALGDDDIQRSLAGGLLPSEPPSVATIDYVPRRAERYCRLRLHATGGIGRVWLAHDSDLGRIVALKELRPERADQAALQARFLQEAQITGQLEHPGIIPVYELSRAPGEQLFYTMRCVKGRTLREAARAYHARRLAGQLDTLELPALLSAFVTVCNTVAYAHARGVIHRDLTGLNVMLGDFGEVVVLDWGLAKLVGRRDAEAETLPVLVEGAGADSGYTIHGQALGTPSYMAPEQAAGHLDLIDRRTDVYGLGAILYEILTGHPPFVASDTDAVLRKVQQEEPIAPRRLWPEVPPTLEALCLQALAKSPADRPAAATDLAHEVQGWQEFERRKAEEALRDSEVLYHSLVESLPCSVFRKDLEGRFTFANQRYCELVGRPLEQLLGKTDFDINPRDLAEKYCRDDRKVIESGGVLQDIEEHLSVQAKGKRYMHTLKTAVQDVDGKVIGIQGICWDVTARKLAEEELAYERYLLHSLMDTIPDNIYFKDRESRFIRINKAMRLKKEFAFSDPAETLGKTDFDFFTEEHARQAYEDEREIMRTGQPLIDTEEKETWRDGQVTWVSTTKMPLRDAQGHIIGTFGISRDITERKQVAEALARERDLLHALMDNLPDGIYFKDTAGRFLRINRFLAEYLGHDDPAEVVGKTDFDFFTEEYAGIARTAELDIIRTGRPLIGIEERVTWRDGRERWISTTRVPLRDRDEKIIGILGVFRSISGRGRAEPKRCSDGGRLR
jgi:PAS domain S-box-containing protein